KEALQVMNLIEEVQAIYISHKFSSLLDETDINGSAVRDEDLYSPEPNVSSNSNLDSSFDSVKSPGSIKGKPSKKSGLPCEAWWKRQAASFYAQAKEANTFWSVFVAAAQANCYYDLCSILLILLKKPVHHIVCSRLDLSAGVFLDTHFAKDGQYSGENYEKNFVHYLNLWGE
ncbi:hypothetical protein FRX31_029430, partial [Thalictrum thalictroides]